MGFFYVLLTALAYSFSDGMKMKKKKSGSNLKTIRSINKVNMWAGLEIKLHFISPV